MYAVIAIVISILVVSEWFRDLVFEPMVLFFAPILNQMLIIGVVSLPGMMTGQIL